MSTSPNIHVYSNENFSDSYCQLIEFLLKQGVTKAPRGLEISHLQNCLFHVENPETVFSCATRPYNWKYLNDELKLYFEGVTSAEEFSKASKFWGQLANKYGNINSSYGYRIFYRPIYSEVIDKDTKETNYALEYENQWQYAKSQLIADKDTRQALMFVSGPDVQYQGNKDFICTLTYLFNIENDTLNITVNRRSQDLYFGIPYDFAWEYLLLKKMHSELVETYSDLKLGSYTMFCNNIHIYKRNFDVFSVMLDDYKNGHYENQKIDDYLTKENMNYMKKQF